MTHWQTITRALHREGGGPLPRRDFDRYFTCRSLAGAAIQRARVLGLVGVVGEKGAARWTLTDLGRAWCDGSAVNVTAGWRNPAETAAEREQRIARLVAGADDAMRACAALTERQLDVLALVSRGYSGKEIARELGMQPRSVGKATSRMLAAMGCTRSIDAAVLAAKAGLA